MNRPKIIEFLDAEDESVAGITIAEARKHLEDPTYGDSDLDPLDDEQILGFVAGAVQHCEEFLGLTLRPTLLEIALDDFPRTRCYGGVPRRTGSVLLPWGPLRRIVLAGYGGDVDSSDFVPLDPLTDFILDSHNTPAQLFAGAGGWPYVTPLINSVRVQYEAGYGVDSDFSMPLPPLIRSAILLATGEFYANRENAGDVELFEIPQNVKKILRPLRVRLGMA